MIDLKLETERHRKLHDTSIFVLKLLVLGLFFRLLVALSPSTYNLQAILASHVSTALSFIGVELQRQGALLIGERGSYLITQDCLGWKSMAAFTGLLVASAENLETIWKYLLAGVAALAAVNFIRIVTTVLLSYHGVISFEVIHTLFWKWGMTVFVFGFWLLYLRKAN